MFFYFQVPHCADYDLSAGVGDVPPGVTHVWSAVRQGGGDLLPQRNTFSTNLAGIF